MFQRIRNINGIWKLNGVNLIHTEDMEPMISGLLKQVFYNCDTKLITGI
jgi:hypothetical protein